ncbi:MAG: prepilin-type N-terminal cleavage/methylation domain-containing protein [Candidatus Sumerlaeota bacterium]|nr:prepilin-type N-terminal cleavage/methylation domain-containing protein [Candidatus Sumerlaeota bacterium]
MKTRQTARSAFTLIELLIVIAIIAILALIAIPNFLEAQTRGKVARSKADMRTLAMGVEVMRTDKNVMLVDYWGDDTTKGNDRLHIEFGLWSQNPLCVGGVTSPNDTRGGSTGVYVPLTTPIAYLTSIPKDPFAEMISESAYSVNHDDAIRPRSYMYTCRDSSVTAGTHWVNKMPSDTQDGDYVLVGIGPALTYKDPVVLYDPSNGTISMGLLVYSSRYNFAPNFAN